MARLLFVAASAPLMLIGANYPGDKPLGNGPGEMTYPEEAAFPEEVPVTYRPCRPGPGDDRCIQLYERGVRSAYARWLRAHDAREARTEVAMGGPEEPVAPPRRRYRERDGHHRGDVSHRRHHRCEDDGPRDREYGDEARGM